MVDNSATKEIRTWTTSRVVLATVFVVCVFLTFWLAYRVRLAIFLLFTAIVIGTAIRPGVEWLRERGVLRPAGVIVIYVTLTIFVIAFLALVAPLIANQGAQVYQTIPSYYTAFRNWMMSSSNHLIHNLGLRIPTQIGFLIQPRPSTQELFGQVTQTFVYARLFLKSVFEVLAVFLLAYYWTEESNLVIRTLLRFVPRRRRAGVRDFLHAAESRLGGYLRGQSLLCLAVGACAFVAYLLIGLPFALVLSIIAGLMEMIPVFGPLLGAIPAVLVALSVDPGKVLWVLLATGIIQALENAWLVPHVMRNSLGINPIIIILSLVAFGSVFGFLGALLAIPLAAIIQLTIDRIMAAAESAEGAESPSSPGIESLLAESQELDQVLEQGSAQGEALAPRLADTSRGELLALSRELGQLLQQIQTEDDSE